MKQFRIEEAWLTQFGARRVWWRGGRANVFALAAMVFFACLISSLPALAQTASLRGHVTDETGAVIPGATVTATGASGNILSAKSASDGAYVLSPLPAGTYQVVASFPGFVLKAPVSFVAKGHAGSLDLVLAVDTVVQQVTVQADQSTTVSLDPANNASALVLQGTQLETLADNPEDLASDLQSIAGSSAGPGGGAFYYDGFSTGEMPAKEAIREIRINQNPFSPEFDKLGLGRIEIFTKPGAASFHGSLFGHIGDTIWNSRNPYSAVKAPFLLQEYGGNLTGPLGHRASFTLNLREDDTSNGAVINGATLDPASLAIIDPYSTVFSVPQIRRLGSPRLDYQLNPANTATVTYQITQIDIGDSGLGGFNLAESAYQAQSLAQTAQLSETAVLNASSVNDTRFQFFNISTSSSPINKGPSIQVLNAFTGGGASVGDSSDLQRNFELQNITTLTRGTHVWHFGGRLRAMTDRNISRQNFNGTFTFGGGTGPELNANDQPVLDANGNTIPVAITSIEQYRRTLVFQKQGLSNAQIKALGGGASQLTISAGNPLISASQVDLALFGGDTWKVTPNLTLDLGLRYETQNNISDHADFAPRIAVSWAPRQFRQKLVLRGGFGIFYDRFLLANTLAALRYNGSTQQQYVVNNPDNYPAIPPTASLASSQSGQVIQQNAPALRAPYLMQSLFSVERQLPYHTVLSLSYSNSHGLHQLLSRDLNAPLGPGGPYPLGNSDPIFQVQSAGLYNQNQLIANVKAQINSKLSLFGSYTFGYARSNTDGVNTFPANPYSTAGEYGPAATDIRNSETFGGTFQTLWNSTFSPLLTATSGVPFNITVGQDLYGTTLFNARPGLAPKGSTKTGLVATTYGLLDPNPSPGETLLPRNFGRGPGAILLNLRMSSRNFGFGPMRNSAAGAKQKDAARPYGVVFSLHIRNLINHNNPGPIIGNIASPLFARSNQIAGAFGQTGNGQTGNTTSQTGAVFAESANNRRLEFQARIAF